MRSPVCSRKIAFLALPLALFAAIALPAVAEQNTQLELPHATIWNGPPVLGMDAPVAGDAMRAAIDPRTGELRRPTAAQVLTLDALETSGLRRVFAASEVEQADGTVMLEVDPELLNYSVVRILDGHVGFVCVDGPTSAAAHVHSTPAPAVEVK